MDPNSDSLQIRLKLGSRPLTMMVRRADEELYRAAERLINERFSYYSNHYPAQGSEMYLTMMALDVAVQLKAIERDSDPRPAMERIDTLIREVEQVL